MKIIGWLCFLAVTLNVNAQNYPQNYFRHPLKIPMQLVANFGEIRTNHWHMGLDIRTQQRVNIPVYAAAEGYVSRVVVEPGGFGQAIYIAHPNGYTTLYAHMNAFYPALARYVKEQQYQKESWHVNLQIPAGMFPLKKFDYIGLSGSTGGSQGPHVHFEIRDTKTENCYNPLLFNFPIPDAVAPSISKLAMYDRNKSTWMQSPQVLQLRKSGSTYSIPSGLLRVGSDRVSFAIAAVDRFSKTPNPNGIYAASVSVNGKKISGFRLDNVGYDKTRYLNAQLDIPYKTRGGGGLQHITPLPGDKSGVYETEGDGVIQLQDESVHDVVIEVLDTKKNKSTIRFRLQYDPSIKRYYDHPGSPLFLPNKVNEFAEGDFRIRTTAATIYDTVAVRYQLKPFSTGASPVYEFMSAAIPVHDEVKVQIKLEDVAQDKREKVIIKNISGTRITVQKASWEGDWATATFRQFGSYQAFIDEEAPTINPPPTSVAKSGRIAFTPRDNFNAITYFRAELDGKWLRFSNDKGKTWIYTFDEKFPRGTHELKVTVRDAAGNTTTRSWNLRR